VPRDPHRQPAPPVTAAHDTFRWARCQPSSTPAMGIGRPLDGSRFRPCGLDHSGRRGIELRRHRGVAGRQHVEFDDGVLGVSLVLAGPVPAPVDRGRCVERREAERAGCLGEGADGCCDLGLQVGCVDELVVEDAVAVGPDLFDEVFLAVVRVTPALRTTMRGMPAARAATCSSAVGLSLVSGNGSPSCSPSRRRHASLAATPATPKRPNPRQEPARARPSTTFVGESQNFRRDPRGGGGGI